MTKIGALDLQAHVRCGDAVVTLTYPTALYVVALLDVLEKLAADRYGAPPRPPFGAFRNAVNAAARELASASSPAGTCADESGDDDGPTLVCEPVMSTREAAAMLSITPAGARYLIKAGLLAATRLGNQWAVSAASVATYRASRKRKDAA
ncbi:MAG TPA: helix-turn-helix domain-containing protein [Mycobacterium sp.]|nr:helix-turn-helix domain-containing protein [Mycobacterium sp.]HTX96849.1 helix-turn-helix domain-containing protein [Mycobacterium sp.]